jgi:hypothetical protein
MGATQGLDRFPVPVAGGGVLSATNNWILRQEIAEPNPPYTNIGDIFSLSWINNQYVIFHGSNSQYWWTSPDGITWTRTEVPSLAIYPSDVAFNGSVYAGVQQGTSQIYYSANSSITSTWASATYPFGVSSVVSIASNGAGLFVATSTGGQLASSTDGINWTIRTTTGAGGIMSVSYDTSGFWGAVDSSSGGMFTSTNGTTWTARGNIFTSSATKTRSAAGNGYFVVAQRDSTGTNFLYYFRFANNSMASATNNGSNVNLTSGGSLNSRIMNYIPTYQSVLYTTSGTGPYTSALGEYGVGGSKSVVMRRLTDINGVTLSSSGGQKPLLNFPLPESDWNTKGFVASNGTNIVYAYASNNPCIFSLQL